MIRPFCGNSDYWMYFQTLTCYSVGKACRLLIIMTHSPAATTIAQKKLPKIAFQLAGIWQRAKCKSYLLLIYIDDQMQSTGNSLSHGEGLKAWPNLSLMDLAISLYRDKLLYAFPTE